MTPPRAALPRRVASARSEIEIGRVAVVTAAAGKGPMLHLPPQTGTERLAVLLIAIVLVTFVIWGSWIIVALVIAGTGWILSAAGRLLEAAATFMATARGVVAWIAVACGVVLGGILALDLPLERVWGPLRRFTGAAPRDVGEST